MSKIPPNPKADKLLHVATWTLEQAMPIAYKYLQLFAPMCHYAAIAGGIRRKRSHINELEIVCAPHRIPHYETKVQKLEQVADLFNAEVRPEPEKILLGHFPEAEFISLVNSWYKIKGDPEGRQTIRRLPEGLTLALYMTTEADFFRMFTMRTGSADFFKNVIAKKWVQNGWRGTEDGLRLNEQCIQKGDKWVCTWPTPTLPPEWKAEEEFFNWLGLAWCPPENRY